MGKVISWIITIILTVVFFWLFMPVLEFLVNLTILVVGLQLIGMNACFARAPEPTTVADMVNTWVRCGTPLIIMMGGIAATIAVGIFMLVEELLHKRHN